MTRIGSVYGEALYALAQEEALTERILGELTVLEQVFRENPDFIRLLSSRSLPMQERCAILDSCFRGRVQPYVLNFLKILTEKGYIKHFRHCCAAYEDHYNADNGILPVTAVTAVALTSEQAEKLTATLSRTTGMQVKLRSKVDPTVLGGVRLDYGGKRLDDTLAHRLEAIRSALKSTLL